MTSYTRAQKVETILQSPPFTILSHKDRIALAHLLCCIGSGVASHYSEQHQLYRKLRVGTPTAKTQHTI